MSEPSTLDALRIGGEARLEASISMLYTDILSEELNSSLSNPDTVTLIQKHLQKRSLDNLRPEEVQPLMESVPESFIDVAKEAAFASGALLKKVPCFRQIKVGDSLEFRSAGVVAEIVMKDARVVKITPFQKRVIND